MGKEKKAEPELQDKQVPEKPRLKSSGMSMLTLIGIIAGVVIIQVVIVILVIKLFVVPSVDNGNGNDDKTKTEKVDQKDIEAEKLKKQEEQAKEEKELIYENTGRITTNPRGSTDLVVVDLGLEFKFEGEAPKPKEKETSILPEKLMARIKGTVNSIIGSYSSEQLNQNRDTLVVIFKDKLKEIFKSILIEDKKILLKNVYITEFIIQKS